MKRIFSCFIVCMCVVMLPVWAESPQTSAKKEATPSKDEEAKRAEMRKRLEEKRAEINGSEWEVAIKQQVKVPGSKPAFEGQDTLIFQDGRFRSEATGELGYTPTNYTLTVQDVGPTIWETMQTSGKGEVTFWRGEWTEKSMTGVVNRQLGEEKGYEEYYFTSVSTRSIPPTSPKDETEEEIKVEKVPEVLSSTPVTPKVEPKKKKSGFWSS